MSTRNDGGPAFPMPDQLFNDPEEGWVRASEIGGGETQYGISVRDYFAAQALAGMCASPPAGMNRDPNEVDHAGWARNAYLFADAMLAARDTEEE